LKIKTFIPDYNLPKLAEKIAKLSKKAKKIGTKELTLVETGVEETKNYNTDQYSNLLPCKVRWIEVEVSGEAPIFNGWKLLAKADHSEGLDLIKSVPGNEDEVPAHYHGHIDSMNCDHCHTRRARNTSYILKNVDTAKVKQVGSTCVSDFIGSKNSPETVVARLEFASSLAEVFEDLEDDMSYGGKQEFFFGIQDVLAAAIVIIRRYGYVSKSRAYEDNEMSTVDYLMEAWFPGNSCGAQDFSRQVIAKVHNKVVQEEADTIIEWVKSTIATSEYFINLRKIFERPDASYRNLGYVVSTIVAWRKEMDEKRSTKIEIKDEWAAPIKKRFAMTVKVLSRKTVSGYYGDSVMMRMIDSEGHIIIWFASGSTHEMSTGKEYKVKATVKKHDFFNGAKQTVVTRLVLS